MADLITPYAQRLCLSGVESRRLLDTFRDFGVKHIQVSFYYLRKVFGDPLEFEPYAKEFSTVIIDSGTVYGNIKTEHERRELLEDYGSYLGALDKRVYTAAVAEQELDLDHILPDEMLIYPLDDIRSVFDNDISSIFKNIKYVGVSHKECAAKGGENLPPLFAHASKTGAFVHAFGTSSRRILTKYPFYSANSSSWRSGSRYLNTYIYEGGSRGLRLYQPTDKKDPVKTEKETKAIRRRQKNMVKVRQPDHFEKVDWDEAIEGDSWEVDKGNLTQWLLYQRDLENAPHNKYFLTDNERTDILFRKRDLLATSPKTEDPEPAINPDIQAPYIGGADIHEIVDADVVEESPNMPAIINPLDVLAEANKPTPRITPVDDRMRQLRNCNFCILADRCPKFTPDGLCAYGLPPEKPTYDHDNMQQVVKEQFADVMAMQMDRMMQLYMEEKMDSSGANKDLTTNIKLWAEIISLYNEAISNVDHVKIDAKGPGVIDMFRRKE